MYSLKGMHDLGIMNLTNPGAAPESIDYDRLGEATAKAMEGMGVYMDSKPVGKLVTPTVNDELGKLERRKT